MPQRLSDRARHRRPPGADEATDAALRRLARLHDAPGERAEQEPVDGSAPAVPLPVSGPGPGPGPVSGPVSGPARRPALGALIDRLPVALRGATWSATGRALAALVAVLLLAVVVTAALVWWSRPRATALPRVQRLSGAAGTTPVPVSSRFPAAAADPSAHALADPSGTSQGRVVVHVAGAVRRPGLVTLPAGSRVADAVDAAGGATGRAELASVNLARLLVDGEQLLVLRRGQAAGPGGIPAAGAAAPPTAGAGGGLAGPVDLNTATLEQLDALPGIGPVLAQRILDWRTAHGRFGSVDELSEVSGIGEKTLADLRPQVRV